MADEIDIYQEIHGKSLEAIERIYNDYEQQRIGLDTAKYALNILSNGVIGLSNDRDIVELMSEMSNHLRKSSLDWNDGSKSYFYTKADGTVLYMQVFALEYRIVMNYFHAGEPKRRVFEYETYTDCGDVLEKMLTKLIENGFRLINWNF